MDFLEILKVFVRFRGGRHGGEGGCGEMLLFLPKQMLTGLGETCTMHSHRCVVVVVVGLVEKVAG